MAWDAEQRRNAAIIAQVGAEVGASARDIQTALMAAIVESGLRNLDYGDRDSIGLFQQRNSWGSREQRLDPYSAARMFFTGGSKADGYSEPGLLDKANRNQMSLGEAAQSVQVSAYPDRYAEHQAEAAELLRNVGGEGVPGTLGRVPGIEITPGGINSALADTLGSAQPDTPTVNAAGEWTNPAALGEAVNPALAEATNPALGEQQFGQPEPMVTDPLAALKLPSLQDYGVTDANAASGWRKQVVQLARKFLGTPYVWGGTTPSGFDCSGLIQYVFDKAGINLPRISADQARAGKRVGLDQLQVGDLVGWDNSSRNNGADHIALYIGGGKIIEAPRPGASVQISNIYDQDQAWGVRIRD